YLNGGSLNVEDSTFSALAQGSSPAGGGIYVQNASAQIIGSTFGRCSVSGNSGHGGAIYAFGGDSLTIQDSVFASNKNLGVDDDSNLHGGAIYVSNVDEVVIERSAFENNRVSISDSRLGYGGAISREGPGSMRISRSSFSGNSISSGRSLGGAVYSGCPNSGETAVTIENSTFSENSLTIDSDIGLAVGGALAFSGGSCESPTDVQIRFSTFSENSAVSANEDDPAGRGGAFSATSASQAQISLYANIMYGNVADDRGPVCTTSTGVAETLGYNVFDDLTFCELGGEGSSADTTDSPSLQPLATALNGTVFYWFDPDTSSALDLVPDTDCPETDQIGIPRPDGDFCDAGAFEYTPAFVP
ncbi:MAG: right-handed parallel beta-helix repeat-containing protein, partial [Myxococcales bacterium]|nr:right-handed parallel beta-helix repeat-containing protein [Myxococcales bacterium]